MRFHTTDIEGLLRIEPFVHEDSRGNFVKTFHAEEFEEQGLRSDLRESFYSESVKGVIRGMHFQWPPMDHSKIVFCMAGEVLDVILDLRKESETYGRWQTFNLSAENKHILYIPNGLAHGFCSVSDKTTLFYFTTREYDKEHDTGIFYDSFGFQWPVENPVLSERDSNFVRWAEFESPF